MATSGWSGPRAFSNTASRAFVERLGLGVAALGLVQRGQIVEADSHVRVVGPEGLLGDSQVTLVEGLGLNVTALGIV